MSEYQFINRNFKKSIILLPGWAMDYKVFENLNIDFNYFLPINFNPYNFKNECLGLLKDNNLKKISLLGWSLGGNAAFQFAIKYPELLEKLILVSVKPKYEIDGIEKINAMLKRNKKAYLAKFYQQCFSEDEKEKYAWFKNNLQKYYLDKFNTEELIRDLDYLLDNPFLISNFQCPMSNRFSSTPSPLPCSLSPEPHTQLPITLHPLPPRAEPPRGEAFTLTFIHGTQDRIVPVADIALLKSLLPHAEYKIIKNSGHLPFLSNDML